MKLGLTTFVHDYAYPAKSEPVWASRIERWTQLDAASFGLAEAYTRAREKMVTPPSAVFLASPTASNVTDLNFAASGARSPAKFVHTLPNIRSAVLLKLADWEGPMYCLQRDPRTVSTALIEAADLLRAGNPGPVWVASVFESSNRVLLGVLEKTSGASPFSVELSATANEPAKDPEILSWFSPGGTHHPPRLSLAPRWEIVKSADRGLA